MRPRLTTLGDTSIAAAIAGCVIPLLCDNTIWVRWRCAADIVLRSAVFGRYTSALLHLSIWLSKSGGERKTHPEK